MNRDDYLFALSERDSILSLLDSTSDDDIIGRMSLESRLYEIDEKLSQVVIDEHPPVKATLTFKGSPVLGTYGIAANFGAKIVNAFNDAISHVASSFYGTLPSKGKIPNIENNLLMITGTAKGSFGFTLEEFSPDAPLTLDEESSVQRALNQTHSILQMSIRGDDDGLAEAISDLDDRALDKIRGFIQILFDNRTTFTLKHNNRALIANNINDIERATFKLSKDSVKEELQLLEVSFMGALPHKRQCEFIMEHDESKSIFVAKISNYIENPDIINDHRGEKIIAKFLCTQVGNGKPKYSLRELPNWR
ncbi:hypothetical protein [Superficieibacter sp. 1612_C1]|uniref:hypothetical protein n=1 Tax=Superficieibacter sp. 1612_C1 TaxID=2780382 RepID=UPI0018837662|nr:hypothetical protein [Superficieibacter sp. 1612_C1]